VKNKKNRNFLTYFVSIKFIIKFLATHLAFYTSVLYKLSILGVLQPKYKIPTQHQLEVIPSTYNILQTGY